MTGQQYVNRYATKKAEDLPTAEPAHVSTVAELRRADSHRRASGAPPTGSRAATIAGTASRRAAGRLGACYGRDRDLPPRRFRTLPARGRHRPGPGGLDRPPPGRRTRSPRVVDGQEVDLGRALPAGAKVAVITADSEEGRHVLRHSTAHVMAQAVTRLFPGAKYTIGPAIENGFYYDFELPGGATFTDDDLAAIDAEMRKIIAEDQPFVRSRGVGARGPRGLRRPALQAGDHRAGRRPPGRHVRQGRGRRRRRRRPLPQHARVRRPLPRSPRALHGPARSLPAAEGGRRRTGAATRSGRCSSGSTARPGRATRR